LSSAGGRFIPSFSAIYLLWLGKLMPHLHAPSVLIVIAASLMIFGAAIGPEIAGGRAAFARSRAGAN